MWRHDDLRDDARRAMRSNCGDTLPVALTSLKPRPGVNRATKMEWSNLEFGITDLDKGVTVIPMTPPIHVNSLQIVHASSLQTIFFEGLVVLALDSIRRHSGAPLQWRARSP
jgi:hypothetical protein